MMNFLAQVKRAGQAMVLGENGHAELSKEVFDDNLLALFQKLVRGMQEDEIVKYVQSIQDDAIAKQDVDLVKRMFLLAFSTRNCRGGKGEKKIFYFLLKALYEVQPLLVLEMLDLVPQYGYWKDLFLFLVEMEPLKGTEAYENIKTRVFDICADQHRADLMVMNGGGDENAAKKELSLYAKYVPSEKSSLDKKLRSVNEIAKRVYGDVEEKKMMFRTDIAAMRKQLRVTETFMCSKRYSEINFATVPSVCMKKNTLAFLNDKKGAEITENGTRFPDDIDRVRARKRMIDCLQKDKIKGAQVFPHELVEIVLGHNKTSATGLLVVDAQWKAMRENVVQQIEQRKAKLKEMADKGQAAAAVDLGNCVCMADVSGSMSGTPMMVAIAMGILLSEISHPAYRDVVMTFSGQPTFHDLSKHHSFVDKAKNLIRAPWGMNTDFYKALQEIGKVAAINKLKQEDLPNLLVVSDMQFDSASGGANWNTAYDNIKQYFHKLGQNVHGKPFDPPTIIFWNVRAGSAGFPCRADQQGVVLMSGFSPSLMKFLLSGEMQTEDIEVDEDTGVVKKVKRQITPQEMLDKVLQDETLDEVRKRLDELHEIIKIV